MGKSREASLVAQTVKNLPAMQGDSASIPELGRSPREGHGNPLQYSCLENPKQEDRQRSLLGYSPWGHKELDMTEWLSTAHTLYNLENKYLKYKAVQESFSFWVWKGKSLWARVEWDRLMEERMNHDLVFKVGFGKMERMKKSLLVAIKWAKAHVFLEQFSAIFEIHLRSCFRAIFLITLRRQLYLTKIILMFIFETLFLVYPQIGKLYLLSILP